MNENMMNRSYEVQVEGDSLGRYTAKTFGWMFAGLLVTFIVAVGFAMTGTIFYIYSFRYWPLALLAAELGVVIYLSARIEKMSVGMARSLFFLYAFPGFLTVLLGTVVAGQIQMHLFSLHLGASRKGSSFVFFIPPQIRLRFQNIGHMGPMN